MTSSKRHKTLTLVVGAGALLTALAAGSLIGGLGPTAPSADAVTLVLPSATATATSLPTPAPRATAAPTATAQPTRMPSLTRTAPARTPTSTPAPPAASPPAPAIVEYIVQRGDVLFGLAQRFNTTGDAIIALNPQINPESLTVGEVLRIPDDSSSR